ncbi:MAG: DUF4336 domain-containing protein [Synechococcales bacterium]|nr:DUF4336 domain-containing protein [Synechococcales bacterium]
MKAQEMWEQPASLGGYSDGAERYPESGYLQSHSSGDWSWPLWPILPLYPYGQRRTLRREVVKDAIWTFDQVQGIFYVVVPIRMTVVRLQAGGLLVYAPIAPTQECIRLVRELEAAHGEVRYIILPTTSGLEHKVYVGPFARNFPTAQVFVAPSQWSFPINLPLSWLGFPGQRTSVLPDNSLAAPFAGDFDYAVLGPIRLGLGTFTEVALFHRRSHTLLVTDSVLSIPDYPPDVVQIDPYPLLFHARDSASDPIVDTVGNRRKGWQRIALFAFYFRPSALRVVPLGQAIRESVKAPHRTRRAYFGVFPFRWTERWQQSFAALQGNGRLLVAPILQTLILNRAPSEVIAWADQVSQWNIQRIVPCHLDAPIEANSRSFRQAFTFLEKQPQETPQLLPEEDFELLRELEISLNKRGITPPAKEKI